MTNRIGVRGGGDDGTRQHHFHISPVPCPIHHVPTNTVHEGVLYVLLRLRRCSSTLILRMSAICVSLAFLSYSACSTRRFSSRSFFNCCSSTSIWKIGKSEMSAVGEGHEKQGATWKKGHTSREQQR